jgi:hypothetical protein
MLTLGEEAGYQATPEKWSSTLEAQNRTSWCRHVYARDAMDIILHAESGV